MGGKFIGVADPPLLDVKVANPVNYLKIWWAKVIGNEGIDISFRIHPLTAITIAAVIGGLGFGLGRITVPDPLVKYVPFLVTTPSPTANPWRETAYTGTLRYSELTKKYYLEVGTSSGGETINLEILPNLNLAKFVGRRILAIGMFNEQSNILKVREAADLEVLPSVMIAIPTLPPSPTPVSRSF